MTAIIKNGIMASTERHSLTPPSNCTDNYPLNNHNNLAHNKLFKLLSTNFRGIRSKVESFINILNEESPDFIAGTESWLNSSVFNNEIFSDNYQAFHKDRTDGYGGVLFACLNNFTPCEAIACKIDLSRNGRLIVLTAYRPPNSDREYMYNLCQFIEEIHNKYIDVMWITGDFNLSNIDWNLNSVTSNTYPLDICNMLIDVLSVGDFSQLVTTPTRGHNILDLFATNRPTLIEHLNVISGVSNHEIIKVESSLSAVIVQHKPRKVYLWNRANFTNINESWSAFSNSFIQSHNIDTPIPELWDIFKAQCVNSLNSIPAKLLSSSTKHPWITSAIKRLSNKKKRLYNKARLSNRETDWFAYKEIKKLVQRESRKAHDSYVSTQMMAAIAITIKDWSYIKSKRKDQCGILSLEKDNQTITDGFCKATILNDQFQSVFTDTNSTPTVPLEGNTFPHIPPINITTEGVLQLLQELDPHKASGPDGIPSKFLKETSVSIAPSLTLIYQALLHQGELPSDWKMAYVTPVYKKGSHTNPSNYRPISLTCICCKLLEHIIYSAISSHANVHNIMCTNQHGFRKKRSCETQLLETVNNLTGALDAGYEADILFLDFSKAFDRVSHNCLLYKLLHYGISSPVYNWITNFLFDRRQQVILDNCYSNPCKVSSGVPQGSVLGPYFSCYILMTCNCLQIYPLLLDYTQTTQSYIELFIQPTTFKNYKRI